MKSERIALLIGIVTTTFVSLLTWFYLKDQNKLDIYKSDSVLFGILENINHRIDDFKLVHLKKSTSEAPVALVAIDNSSLEELGRWPFSRDTILDITKKALEYKAKVISYDIIFSEKEKGTNGDLNFANYIKEHGDQIILGTTSTDAVSQFVRPYQDICTTEAFYRTGGRTIVQLNLSVVVNDQGFYSEISKLENWSLLFKTYFDKLEADTVLDILQKYKKNSVDELTEPQKDYLKVSQYNNINNFCSNWLTSDDSMTDDESKKKYLAMLKNVKAIPIKQYVGWRGNVDSMQEVAGNTASFNTYLDKDGVLRRTPLLFRAGLASDNSYIPSLALQTYLISTGYRADITFADVANNKLEKRIESFKIINAQAEPEKVVMTIPVDEMGRLKINYYGSAGTLPTVLAEELLSNSDKMKIYIKGDAQIVDKASFMKDRALIMGATALGINDLRNTPFQNAYPGPETHLTILANLFDQNFVQSWNLESKYLPWILFLVGILFSWIWAHSSASISVLSLVTSLSLISLIDAYIFKKYQVFTSVFFIFLTPSLSFLFVLIYKYFSEERKKIELKKAFSKYVSPAVVDELMKSSKNLELGGKKENLTAFFSDLRGFTTLSEKLDPQELVFLLNKYLTVMTKEVFNAQGTLDKYMGDAIMAFFGAPLPQKDHAVNACKCAIESLKRLKELQAEFAAKGYPHLDIGIGINSGDMSVGNMGSETIQNYTVMGDAVNLASRLESINKEYGTKIIIGEDTYEKVKDFFICREVDRVRVKGKNLPVRIYELIADKSEISSVDWIAPYNEAYEFYQKQKFSEAIEKYKQVMTLKVDDPVSALFIERATLFQSEPPPQEWDGVYTMTTK